MPNRLDYCNLLLYDIADTDLTKLQCIQNRLSCVVTKSPSFTHCVPLLWCLHWLPVKFRILFIQSINQSSDIGGCSKETEHKSQKISLLTCKTLHEKQPFYLHSVLSTPLPSRSLRSNKGISLSVHRVKTKTSTGVRAFHSCASSLWNNLPLSVCSAILFATFKKHLKTHLFYLAFPL